jgi:hypothetical protein
VWPMFWLVETNSMSRLKASSTSQRALHLHDIGNPLSGSIRAGQLEGQPQTGDRYDPETIKRMMRELWAEYVEAIPNLFNTSC